MPRKHNKDAAKNLKSSANGQNNRTLVQIIINWKLPNLYATCKSFVVIHWYIMIYANRRVGGIIEHKPVMHSSQRATIYDDQQQHDIRIPK